MSRCVNFFNSFFLLFTGLVPKQDKATESNDTDLQVPVIVTEEGKVKQNQVSEIVPGKGNVK